jgi:hypothetical protein
MWRSSAAPRALTVVALLGTLAGFAGCRSEGAARLEGRWKGTSVEGVAPEAMGAAMAFATDMEIEVKGDVISVTTPQGKQTGRFVVDHEDKSSITIVTDKDDKSDRQTFTFVGGRTMKWAVDEKKGTVITFAKQ